MSFFRNFINWRQKIINARNKKRLINLTPSLICSNCTGGMLYHWLGLQFRSPFINLYMDNYDFLTALENFDEFIESEIIEDTKSNYPYPLGIGPHGEKIHFMHYPDFKTAVTKWNQRRTRIDRNNMAVMLTNLGCGLTSENDTINIIRRFNELPFEHKIILCGERISANNVFYLKGYEKVSKNKNIFATKTIFGIRYIDQFDYVEFINNLKNTKL